MKQTSVEWLLNQLDEVYHIKEKFLPSDWEFIEEQAKAMEKEQMIRFAISCHQNILRDRKAPENIISENLLLFEQYYNETYGKSNT
jgi:hypothetical protein